MKHCTLLSLILISFALVTAQAEPKSSAPTQSKNRAETDIRDWLDRWTKAFGAKNLEAIMALYADDVVAYDVVPPLQYVGKNAYRKDYEQFLAQYEGNLHVEVRDLHIDASGDLGFATGLELISGVLKSGQKSDVWIRFTSLYRKTNGHWLDFHDHVSVPADMESGKAMLDLKP
jgi:uncharacterized protein (TIGR02246 family)